MRVRMFKNQFAELVKSGAKRQTIRPTPKRMPQAGEMESWRQWSGLPYRSKQIELAKVQIISVQPIKLESLSHEDIVVIENKLLPIENFQDFAVADGFNNFPEMMMWFYGNYGESFEGILIKAKDL